MGYTIVLFWGIFIGALWFFTTLTTDEFQSAQNQCKVNDGVSKVVMYVIGSGNVYCNNGAKFQLKDSE